MVTDKFTGAPRGFAFVHFYSVADAAKVLHTLQARPWVARPVVGPYARGRCGRCRGDGGGLLVLESRKAVYAGLTRRQRAYLAAALAPGGMAGSSERGQRRRRGGGGGGLGELLRLLSRQRAGLCGTGSPGAPRGLQRLRPSPRPPTETYTKRTKYKGCPSFLPSRLPPRRTARWRGNKRGCASTLPVTALASCRSPPAPPRSRPPRGQPCRWVQGGPLFLLALGGSRTCAALGPMRPASLLQACAPEEVTSFPALPWQSAAAEPSALTIAHPGR